MRLVQGNATKSSQGCSRHFAQTRWRCLQELLQQAAPLPGGASGHAPDGRRGESRVAQGASAAREAQEHRKLHLVSVTSNSRQLFL